MKYPHVVFDIDNTLTDTTEAVLHSLQRAVRDITGQHLELGRLTVVLGIPGVEGLKRLGFQSPDLISVIYPLWEEYMFNYQHTVYLYEGILPLLEHLQQNGRRLGLITSKTLRQLQTTFEPFGITGFFETVITADDTCLHKPDPAPLNAYAQRSLITPAEILYVGDSSYDMICASSAGADCALALWGCHNPDGISSTYRFDTPAALTDWFREGCPAS